MARKVLIVSSDFHHVERVKEILKQELPTVRFEIDFASNEVNARRIIGEGGCGLVVSSLDIPEDINTSLQEGRWRGFSLAQWITDENKNIPIILIDIAPDSEPELAKAVGSLDNCELVNQRLNWEIAFVTVIKRMSGRTRERREQNRAEKKRLDVDIYLKLNSNLIEISCEGVGFPCSIDRTPLEIDANELLRLEKKSGELETFKENWEEKLRDIGDKLMEQFFKKNKENFKFYGALKELLGLVGGLSNTRIRFIVSEAEGPGIALEAIFGHVEQLEERYWMLHAPIYRTVGTYGGWGYPLLSDPGLMKGPFNILIICASTEGEVTLKKREGSELVERQLDLKPLKNVTGECTFLANFRDSPAYSRRVEIGRVEVIPRPGDRRSFLQQVQETLEQPSEPREKKKTWHIVHYAGHSYFHDYFGGFVFFPGGQDEAGKPLIEPVNIEHLSAWLRSAKTSLLFLSSCHSSELGFVFSLTRQKVPAIVGFRWDVEDYSAVKYSRAFYSELFNARGESLGEVFLKARKCMYEEDENDRTWAAPVLVMQRRPM